MLIRAVHAMGDTSPTLFPHKRSLQTIDPSSFTRLGWSASRRSLVRVSVPVWGTFLSEPLMIVASVGRYPADQLIIRMPTPSHRFSSHHHAVT